VNDEHAFVGVAWADGSWVGATLSEDGVVDATAADEVGGLWGQYGERAERIVVGVPIGLVEDGDPERSCDRLARAVLGDRSDAIPTPPVREATRRRRYPAARRLHERRTGSDLSQAAFALAPAISAVDELLQEVPEARDVVRGSHPDLAFRAFAGEPLAHDPATAGGYAERMRTLADHDAEAPPAVQAAAEDVAGADVPIEAVLEAMVLAYTARERGGALRSLPPDPPRDPAGLPMELVYRAVEPLDPSLEE